MTIGRRLILFISICLVFAIGCQAQTGRKGIAAGWADSGYTHSQLDTIMKDFNNLGAVWLRIDFDWSQIQPNNSTSYETAPYDAEVQAAAAHGIQILGIIDYCPPWANGQSVNTPGYQFYPPKSARAYAAFASYLARRYAPMGVHTWEIWNEPNGGSFWMPSANPSGYARLLKAAYTSIKKVDPTATVITGGLAPACNCSPSLTPMTFLADIYKDGAEPYLDGVGDHPYTYPALPSATDGSAYWWTQMYTGADNLRSIMTQHGDSNKKIWMTEYGAPTNGGSGNGAVTEAVQAKMITIAYRLQATYSWAGPLFWYTYQDGGTDKTNIEDWFGLIKYGGTHKPSYAAYKAVPVN